MKKIFPGYLLLIFFLEFLGPLELKAQKFIYRGNDTISSVVVDSATIVIAKRGLSDSDFINQMLIDTGFYQAFRNLKRFNLITEEDIRTYSKKGKSESHIQRRILHDNHGDKYHQTLLQDLDSGEVFRHNGKYNLFTVQMFHYIFENENNSDLADGPAYVQKSDEGYKQKLKRLIFQPGTPIEGIPFISKKTEVFSPEMRKYYNYSYSSGNYYGSEPVYRFTVSAKPEYQDDGAVMIKELVTLFDKTNFKILGRYIYMKYDNPFFSFDVKMNIETRYYGDEQIPVLIQYAGNWDIPFHKKETAAFTVKMTTVYPKNQPIIISK